MVIDTEFSSTSEASRYSTFWDILAPIVIGAVPTVTFTLLGLVTGRLDKPNAVAPTWVIVVMLALEVFGIVSLAILILVRFETAFKELSLATDGHSPKWRNLALKLSIACLLLSEILANVSGAFGGAGFLLVAAIPTFLAYLLLKRVAFARLPPSRHNHKKIA